MPRRYDALLLDLDGTLVAGKDSIHPRTLATVQRAARDGVRVMIATGRSELAARPVLDRLELDNEAIVYNGAAVYCPRAGGLVEEMNLATDVRDRLLDYAEEEGYLPVVMFAGMKHALAPRNDAERLALNDMHSLRIVAHEELRVPRTIRITLFSERHSTSGDFAAAVAIELPGPVYTTHFPLSLLASHRDSPLQVLDVHPPCRGKAEAFRVLEERYGIAAARVVAVGDATNDISMLSGAGLGVCMEEAEASVRAVAARVIGRSETDTIADLVEELFLT